MPKFRIIVTRETTESAVIVVEADSLEEAEEIAIQNRNSHEYEGDDYVGDVYVSDAREI